MFKIKRWVRLFASISQSVSQSVGQLVGLSSWPLILIACRAHHVNSLTSLPTFAALDFDSIATGHKLSTITSLLRIQFAYPKSQAQSNMNIVNSREWIGLN